MEDDDEFGDLYTDVLRPFSSSSSSAPPPLHRPIDLNRRHDDGNPPSSEPSHSNSAVPVHLPNETPPAGSSGFVLNLAARNDAEGKGFASVGVELPNRAFEDRGFGVESGIVGDLENGVNLMDEDVKFDIEEGNVGVEDEIIPGLSSNLENVEGFRTNDAAQDHWDSDSEDDLQIVLNDSGPMAMERGGMGGDDEDDEDDRPLVILGDNDQNQVMEEQEWGEDAVPAADGERKEMGEAAKSSGGMVVAPKPGYSNYGYRPFHSQYKVSVLSVF